MALSRQSNSANPLPKILPGTVCKQWRTCGKACCKCQRGELHGPYYYRFWREQGRLCKQYIPLSQVEAVRELCGQRQQWEEGVRQERKQGGQQWRQLRDYLREVEAQWMR